ncbi:MAG TPA: hypothetical protein VGY53_06895 [Isosphaeraceae bacterium]|nr:hypothetical protein [Isosphaeraceae bacterium]
MSCRRPAIFAALAAALILAARPAPVRASGITSVNGSASYELVNNSAPGTAPVTKIVANVVPPGEVVPPNPSVSPLTILSGSTGFDQTNLKVLLGTGQTPTGDPLQALALDFGTQGFAPGGVLNFSLSLDKAFSTAPTLSLPDSSSGLSITQLANTTGPSSNQPSPTTQGSGTTTSFGVPEPGSLAVWSAAAMAIVFAGLRRARRAAVARD